MVRRRLNKKVVFFGTAFFVIIVLGFVIAFLQLGSDPQELLKDAEAARQTASQSTDPKIREEQYEIAKSKYGSAYMGVETNQERKEILFKMVDLSIEMQDWPYVLDYWDNILIIEPENVEAQYGRLRYFEILGDSGIPNVWSQVNEYATKFLETAQKKELMNEDMESLRIPALEKEPLESKKLGAYLYLIKGKSAFEQVSMGSVAKAAEMLDTAIADLEKSKELESDNIDVYLNLSRAILAKGELAASKGSADERTKAEQQVLGILEEAVNNSTNKVKARINLINFKVVLARDNEQEQVEEQFKTLESDYLAFADNYSSNADVYEALSQFYSIYSQYTKRDASRQNLDKAIDAISKAMELDENNAFYAVQITELLYQRYSIYKSDPDLVKATEIAHSALTWPDSQNTSGPRNNLRIRNKYLLNTFLANSYLEQILNPSASISDSDKNVILGLAQEAVHEIEMIIRTEEDPTIIKWQGMLELAKGNRQGATIKLNKAYEQFKSIKPAQPPWPLDIEFARLSYTLAKLFMGTEEIGKVNEFLVNAHYAGITEIKPEARLDYVEVILSFNRFSDALENIDSYEEDYGPSKRTRELRIRTNIYSNQYEEAQKELDTLSPDDPETIQLRLALVESQIRKIQMSLAQKQRQDNANSNSDVAVQNNEVTKYIQESIGLLKKLLDAKPDSVDESLVINIYRACILNNELGQAKLLVEMYLGKYPENITMNIYHKMLSEPDPEKITQERYVEIEKQVLSDLPDPIKRAANLGMLYQQTNEISKAIEQYNIVLGKVDSIDATKDSPELDDIKLAASHLFEIALSTQKLEDAENVVKKVREKNLDGFKGLYYEARLTAVKGDLKNALAKVDECLKEHPISSTLYMLRSNINAALGNEYAYMEDISKAAYLNPLDNIIAKRYAIVLYNRDRSSKNELTAAQLNQTRDALEKAIALNQGDMDLLGVYAEYIAPTEPDKAVAILQDISAAAPSVDNAMSLASLAMNVANNTADPDKKEVFFDIAGSALEQARQIDPNDRMILLAYTNYLQSRGRDEQAKMLLAESKDDVLVANNLFQEGDFEGAQAILEKLYREDSNNVDVLKGLMLVGQKLNDKEAVKKYSGELLSLRNNLSNLVLQIRAYITVGLFTDAEYKLQSLKERYPDEADTATLQAWLVLKQGNANKALDIINGYLQTNRTNSAAWQLRSEINVALNQYERAISDLKTCKSLSDDPAILVQLAKVYLQVSKYDDAEAELKEVVETQESPAEAYLLLESIYLQFNRKSALDSLYDKIIEKHPDSVQWLNKAASFALQSVENSRAEKLYKKSCDIIRNFYTGDKQGKEINDDMFVASFDGYLQALLNGTGDISKEGSHPEKSETVVEEAGKYIDSKYAPMAYLRMSQAQLRLHREDQAAKSAHLALEKARANEDYAFAAMQGIYPILGLEDVVKNCNTMLEENPDSAIANYTLYYLFRLNKQYDKSLSYIRKCIELTANEDPIKYDYIFKKAETLLYAYANSPDNKYITEAINDYKSLLSEMPNNIQVLNNLAYVLAESQQNLSDALKYSKRVQELKPNDPGFLDTYAFVLLKNGEYAEADKAVERSLKEYTMQGQMTIPAEVYEHKGMIKEKLGIKEEALTAYKRAMVLGSEYFSQNTKDRINQAIERVSP